MSPITKPTTDAVPFTVGIALDGAGWHPAAWREPSARPAELFTPDYWQDLVGIAESAGADYATLEDSLQLQGAPGIGRIGTAEDIGSASDTRSVALEPGIVEGRLDALLTASWIAPRTRRIGLIPAVTTTHTEPFHVATALQTLDHVSQGRAGWQLRFSADAASAEAFGRKPAPEIDVAAVVAAAPDAGLDELTGEAADAAEVARRLWDSWEDDAVIRDLETGRFLDRDRVHRIEFEGERFSVVGPSIVPRSPQGQPPVTLLAHSAPIFALAAQAADVVFVTPGSDAPRAGASRGKTAAEIVAEVRAAEAAQAESGEDRASRGLAPLRIVADLVVALDSAGSSAAGSSAAGSVAGGSEGPGTAGAESAAAGSAAESSGERLARLDAVHGSAFESDAAVIAGSAEEAADLIAGWRADGIEGVRLRPLAIPADLIAIASELLPLLRRRGIASAFETEPASDSEPASLRASFGLAPATNRYAEPRGSGSVARVSNGDPPTQSTPIRAERQQAGQQQEVAA